MSKWIKLLLSAVWVILLCCLPVRGDCSGVPADKGHTEPHALSGQKTAPYAGEIIRRGKTVFVSRRLVEEVRKDTMIVLSAVVLKTPMDKYGRLAGYELVRIDRGSIPDRMGFKAGDRIVYVNGIAARDFEAKQAELQSARRFEVSILRKGKAKRIAVEVR